MMMMVMMMMMMTFFFALTLETFCFFEDGISIENPEDKSPSNTFQLDSPAANSDEDDEFSSVQIEVGQAATKLTHLGPMIVNADGTMRRITNWDTLTEAEKANTMRVVGERNSRRLEILKAKSQANSREVPTEL